MTLPTTPLKAIITFCLFHGNDATGSGKDIYFADTAVQPILHSFTTSSGHNIVYPEHWDSIRQQDEWLPWGMVTYF